MSITPTWEHYGTHDDSAYPELWDGCIRAWAPCLGPTGAMLFDLSGMARHGLFTNLSAATGWANSIGGYGLSIPHTTGSNAQYVAVADAGGASITGGLSLCTVLATVTLIGSPPADYEGVFFEPTVNVGYTRTAIYHRTDNSLVFGCRDTSMGTLYASTAASPPIGSPITVAGVWNAVSDFSGLFVNGKLEGSNLDPKGAIFSGANATNSSLGAYTHSTPSLQHSFPVNIYDIRIYNNALDAQRIGLYNDVRLGVYSPRRPRRFYSFADVSNRRRRFFLGAAA